MNDLETPPLPWETKTALGALSLLWLQWVHETWRLFTGRPGYFRGDDPTGAVLWLFLIGILICGLLQRSRVAWQCAVVIPGAVGVLFLCAAWTPMIQLLPWTKGAPKGYEVSLPRDHVWWVLFWMGSRVALHLAAPLFLLLGRLRQQLRRAGRTTNQTV